MSQETTAKLTEVTYCAGRFYGARGLACSPDSSGTLLARLGSVLSLELRMKSVLPKPQGLQVCVCVCVSDGVPQSPVHWQMSVPVSPVHWQMSKHRKA